MSLILYLKRCIIRVLYSNRKLSYVVLCVFGHFPKISECPYAKNIIDTHGPEPNSAMARGTVVGNHGAGIPDCFLLLYCRSSVEEVFLFFISAFGVLQMCAKFFCEILEFPQLTSPAPPRNSFPERTFAMRPGEQEQRRRYFPGFCLDLEL